MNTTKQNKTFRPLLLSILAAIFLLNGCVVQHRTVIKSPPQAYPPYKDYHDRKYNGYDYRFSKREREAFRHYYHPGKGHKKRIPPGHNKRPYKLHKPLPRHVKYRRLPRDLERRLPPPPRDMIRIRIGGDVLLMHRKTRVIYDIIFDQ